MSTHFNGLIARAAVVALSLLVTACGGESDSSSDPSSVTKPATTPGISIPDPQEPAPGDDKDQEPRLITLEGYAVKGAIDGALISLWVRDVGADEWHSVGAQTRTDDDGRFHLQVSSEYEGQALRVSLRSDSQTLMRCDVAPVCRSPSGVMIAFGDWFWPGSDLQLESMALLGAEGQDIALTPLTTLAYEQAGSSGFLGFSQSLAQIESSWRFDAGSLSEKPIDLAEMDGHAITSSRLQSALINTAFMALVDGEYHETLGGVLLSARASVTPLEYLPGRSDSEGVVTQELLGLSSLILLNRLEAIGFTDDHQELALQARAELEDTLVNRGFEAPTSEIGRAHV